MSNGEHDDDWPGDGQGSGGEGAPRGTWSSPPGADEDEGALEDLDEDEARTLRFSVPAGPTDVADRALVAAQASPDARDARDSAPDAWAMDRHRRTDAPPTSATAEPASDSVLPRPDRPSRFRLPAPPPLPDQLRAGGALDLVTRSSTSIVPVGPRSMVEEIAELYALGDFTGALRVAELVLGQDPEHEEARSYAERCREHLVRMYTSKLGSVRRVPVLAVAARDVRWLGLDHLAGFVLSQVDGSSSVEEILDVCTMDRLETLKTLVELVNLGAVRIAQER